MKESLTQLNESTREEFIRICGPLFEHSPWVAERTYSHRPFASLDALHRALVDTMRSATVDEQVQLIASHPDLVGRLAREGSLTRESTTEQQAAGLTQLSPTEIEHFERYNAEYRAKFGFPFVICARENKKDAILAAFPVRLKNTRDQEIDTALTEIAKIARLRLLDAVTEQTQMAHLSADSYGKSDVRLTKVTRRGDVHHLTEMSVSIELRGDFARCYTEGDNSMVIPTDTQKNTVYSLAKRHEFASIEQFAGILAKHFLDNFSHVTSATASIQESLFNRISLNGKPHDHAFIGGSTETRICCVEVSRERIKMTGGIDGLMVLKTTRSGFVNFIKDQFTTLKETTDRIFATIVQATWTYNSPDADFNAAYARIRDACIRVFAEHDSLAVQQTLYAMGEAALEICKDIHDITLSMPNQHRLLVNLQPFGLENANEIFVPTSEPYGKICGTIARG